MKKRPTITDVAQAAGVSLMTVSRVVNDKPGVGEETRQRIRQLIEAMDYRPSEIARGLATRQTSTVAIVVPDITNPFFAQIACGAEAVAFERGYHLFLLNTAESADREIAALDSLQQKEIDGVMLCSPRLPVDDLEATISQFAAVTLFNRELQNPLPNVAQVNINDALGAQLAVRRFVATGRRRLALIAGPTTSTSGQRRIDGYRAGLKEAGLLFDPQAMEHCQPVTEGGRSATAQLLARRPKIDAILAFNDLVAVGAMQACEDAGRRVPEDIAIIGFDDIPLAVMIRPHLTTLHIDLEAVGRLAMHKILEIIQQPPAEPHATHWIDPYLVIRDSA